MKPAARVGDPHAGPVCPAGPIAAPGCPTVLIGGQPAARVGDVAVCGVGTDPIVIGAFGVLIGGQPAARMGDQTAAGGTIVMGCFTVLIGDFVGQGAPCAAAAKKDGAAFAK